MTSTTCELIWLKYILKKLKFGEVTQITLICDNQVALPIRSNPVFRERTGHIETDCHFFQEKIVFVNLNVISLVHIFVILLLFLPINK